MAKKDGISGRGYRCRLDMTPLTSLNLGTEEAGRT
jgi:hypothetical protein